MSDTAQLEYACSEQAVIFTHDADFIRLAHEWLEENREHWGVIYVQEQALSIGECLRRLIDYALILNAEDMKNRVEFL